MEEREVYIVQSAHENPDEGPKDMQDIYRLAFFGVPAFRHEVIEARVARESIKDIILEKSVDQLFMDSTTREYAYWMNKQVRNAKDSKVWLEQIEKYHRGSSHYWIKIVRECQDQSIEVEFQETENKIVHGLFDRFFMDSERWMETGIKLRDYFIHKNMKQIAGQRSILYMGSAHQLVDFYEPDSGFAVAAVTITDQGPQYRYANRDGVPNFFREIVERRYAEMKERAVCL